LLVWCHVKPWGKSPSSANADGKIIASAIEGDNCFFDESWMN